MSETPSQPEKSPASLHPTGEIGSNLVDEAAVIDAVGVTATGSEVTSPAVGTESGWMRRRWESVKAGLNGFDLRNTPAAQAAIESGETFSKWDLAKASLSQVAATSSLMVGILARGLSDPFAPGKVSSRAESRIDRASAGVDNRVIRKKMAGALLNQGNYNNPVLKHLGQYDLSVGLEVGQTMDVLRWKQQNPEKVATARLLGGVTIGLAVPAAAEVISRIF